MAYGDEQHRQSYLTKIKAELAARHQAHIWPQRYLEILTMRQLECLFLIPSFYAIQPPPAP